MSVLLIVEVVSRSEDDAGLLGAGLIAPVEEMCASPFSRSTECLDQAIVKSETSQILLIVLVAERPDRHHPRRPSSAAMPALLSPSWAPV